jgi:hypothetical protein
VIGIAVASRAKANTARTWAQEASASLTPTARRQTSSTPYSDRWLTRVAAVIGIQPCSSRSRVRVRNLTVASSQPCTGGRPTSPSSREATPPAHRPNRSASCSRRSNKAKTTMAATSPAMPSSASMTRVPEAPPWRATRARASTGRPSLAKLFHTPDTSTATEARERE